MIPIDGLTEEQVIDIVSKVANNHKNKHFGYFTSEDIIQEVWAIALDRLKEFDYNRGKESNIEKALEHFLNNVIARRLSNLYRDHYVVPQRQLKSDKSDYDQVKRINLMHPVNISDLSEESIGSFIEYTFDNDHWYYIIHHLSEENIDILDALLSAEKVSCYYKNSLLRSINGLINEYNQS